MSQRGVALFSRGRAAPAWAGRTLPLAYMLIFVNAMQFAAMYAVSPVFKDDLALTKSETSLIFAVSGLATFAAAVPIGLAADRIGARPVCLAGAGLVTVSLVLQALAPDLALLLVARAGIGAGFAGVLAAGPTWISDSVAPERRARAVALIMPIAALGGLLGPILAGTLSDGFGRATPQLLFGALVGVCVLALLASPKGGGERHGHDPFLTTLRLGRRSPIVLTAVAVMFLAAVTEGVTGVLGPQQLDRNGVSASVTGIVLGVGSAAFILVSLVITRHADRVLRLNFAAAAVLILGAICVLLAAAPETIPTSAGLILRTAALGLAFTICFPLAGVGADSVGMGRGAAYAALQAAGGSGSAIGPYASGVIGESVGDWLAYSLVGGLGIVAAVWILSMQRSAKSRAGGGAMLSPMAQAQQRRDADTDAAAAAPAPASAPAGETASP